MGQTFASRGWSQREVRVRKSELLTILHKNREQHIQDYKIACDGYREAALKRVELIFQEVKERLNQLKKGEMIEVMSFVVGLNVPVSHEGAYNQIIRMMEMEVEEVVTLTADQFSCFIQDDWDWTDQFRTSNSPYFGGVKASWQK